VGSIRTAGRTFEQQAVNDHKQIYNRLASTTVLFDSACFANFNQRRIYTSLKAPG
jgi:hypothetical protein